MIFVISGDFDAVTMIHIGNYEDIPTSYIQMMKWIRQNGYTVTGPATEEFILSPLDVNDETRRVTKIIILSRKRVNKLIFVIQNKNAHQKGCKFLCLPQSDMLPSR